MGAGVKAVDTLGDDERQFLLDMRQHLVGMNQNLIGMRVLIERRLGIAPPRSEKVLEPDKEDRGRTRTYHREAGAGDPT